ncbi:MAG: hypothetical protein BGP06_10240 [Rhizobiales bacterium 65-9]|nr:MAG: hypothetical protein BGP06_10240 [Rhizobiales bacterium 65-9]
MALLSSAAFAQTPAPSQPDAPLPPGQAQRPAESTQSAPAQPIAPKMTEPSTTATTPQRQDANAPLEGANSFTEAQARSRIEQQGFSGVSGLAKDDKGVWRGNAMKDGKSMTVMLDYRGNVVSQ